MDNSKIVSILDKVIELSTLKKIEWEKNPKGENSFKATLGENSLHILKISTSLYFIIYTESGEEVARIFGARYLGKLDNLYDLARRKALKIDEKLNELDSFLDKLK